MLTQRLGSSTQKDRGFIEGLLNEIKAHPGCCDEVWFATDYGFPTLEVHKKSAMALCEFADMFREAGIRVSLQLSNSIGHGQYMSIRDCSGLVYDGSPVENMIGHDGTKSDYCFCWRGKNFRKYVMAELYEYVSRLQPHTVWVDDDLRATNHNPVRYGCFCDDCIKAFNDKYGSDFDREEMVNAINSDIEWRKRHIEFLRESLYDFTYEMGTVIHNAAPDCGMGLQYCAHGGYTGFGYDFIFDAMYQSTGIAPASRPGGGTYDDNAPDNIISKAELIGYQNYMLPDYVKDKRPEIESLPDIVYGKSIGGTCLETTYYLASGNNAMSYAILMNDYEPMKWHGKMLGAFAEHRDYWKKLCEYNNISHQSGLKMALSHSAYLREDAESFSYNAEYYYFGQPIRYFNIPVAMTREDMPVFLLSPESARVMSREEVEELLKKPVLTEGASIRVLNERGFDVGADAKTVDTQRLSEFFTSHPVNKEKAGRRWGGGWGRNSNWELVGHDIEVLSRYDTITVNKLEGEHPSTGVFTTPAGAKWLVCFDVFNRSISTEKRDQILDGLAYISGTRFAAELVTPIKAILHPRVNNDGKTVCASVTNCTFGGSGELELIIRNPISLDFTFMSQYQSPVKLTAKPVDGEDNAYSVGIPNINPWSVGTVFCEYIKSEI